MRLRTLFFITVIILILFLYSIRSVLSPFVLALLAAYVFNPVVRFVQHNFHTKRTIAIGIVFLFIIGIFTALGFWVGGTLVGEAREITAEGNGFNAFSQSTINQLPEFNIGGQRFGLKPLVEDLPNTLAYTAEHWQNNLGPVVSDAASRVLNVLVFLVSTFYFLKDGHKLFGFLRSLVPEKYKEKANRFEVEINRVLGNYLRGQILLVLIMSVASWVVLAGFGVKFALTLALLTGFLELLPFIGPILATSLVALTAYLTVDNRWGLDPTTLALVLILIYILLRMIEDYFIIPQILGHVTKLHPLLVLFAVIAGGKLAGAVGFVLAVPIAAAIRIIFIFINEEVNWRK